MLGEKLGVSQQMIAQWENGIAKPKIETIKKLADALEVPVFELTEDYDTKKICKKIGEKLKKLRINQGLTTLEFANLSKIPESIIQSCESGTDIIELELLKQITTALGSSLIGIVDDWSIYPDRPDDFTWYAGNYCDLIKAAEREKKHKETLLLADYRKLNSKGQIEARKRINELTEIRKYTENEDEFYE